MCVYPGIDAHTYAGQGASVGSSALSPIESSSSSTVPQSRSKLTAVSCLQIKSGSLEGSNIRYNNKEINSSSSGISGVR